MGGRATNGRGVPLVLLSCLVLVKYAGTNVDHMSALFLVRANVGLQVCGWESICAPGSIYFGTRNLNQYSIRGRCSDCRMLTNGIVRNCRVLQ